MANEVVFATEDVTVHQKVGESVVAGNAREEVTGVVLSAGDTFPLDSLASYQQEAVKDGKVAGLKVMSESQAKKLTAEVEQARAVAQGAPGVNVFQTVTFTGPDGDDGSFSDHLLADDERAANHAARALSEAGTDVPDDAKLTLPGAESDESPATGGEHTASSTVSDHVQGAGGADAATQEDAGGAQKGTKSKSTKSDK